MPGWLKDLLAGLAAIVAYFTGRKAGEEAVQRADQTAALQQQVEVDHAISQSDAAAPRNPVALADSVRRGADF
jgi:hypothetical protein